MSKLVNQKLRPLTSVALAGLFTALAVVLQKVLAINYVPVAPFIRISFGGPAMIIFSSLFLGPLYGACVGLFSDLLGYFIFDPKNMGFFPSITAIYLVLGFVSFFIYKLIQTIKNKKLLTILEFVVFSLIFIAVSLKIGLSDELTLYSITYSLHIKTKIVIIVSMLILIVGLFLFSTLYKKKENEISLKTQQLSFSLFLIELLVMVMFGSLMKGIAFGFATYPVILLTQIIVMCINVPLNTYLISILQNITKKYY